MEVRRLPAGTSTPITLQCGIRPARPAAWRPLYRSRPVRIRLGCGPGKVTALWRLLLTVNVLKVNTASDSSSTSTGTGLPTPPANAKVWSKLEDSTADWSDCGSIGCAGGANGTSNYWTAPFQGSPSLDGSSRQFSTAGLPGRTSCGSKNWARRAGLQTSFGISGFSSTVERRTICGPQSMTFGSR